MEEFVGFYWTRPVNWAGFRKLPEDANEAAKRSRTIRYQCERVRRWVEREHGKLIHEFVFIDRDADEATPGIKKKLDKAIAICKHRKCRLVYVDFSEVDHWRRNHYFNRILLDSLIDQGGHVPISLSPDAINIDGRLFNPIEHFQEWQATDFFRKDEHRNKVRLAFAEALERIPEGRGRNRSIASYLNELGITTLTGLAWTDETVRKFKVGKPL